MRARHSESEAHNPCHGSWRRGEGITWANEALGNDAGAGLGLELCSGSIQEDCISTRPQVNQCEGTLDYTPTKRVSEIVRTPVVPKRRSLDDSAGSQEKK